MFPRIAPWMTHAHATRPPTHGRGQRTAQTSKPCLDGGQLLDLAPQRVVPLESIRRQQAHPALPCCLLPTVDIIIDECDPHDRVARVNRDSLVPGPECIRRMFGPAVPTFIQLACCILPAARICG